MTTTIEPALRSAVTLPDGTTAVIHPGTLLNPGQRYDHTNPRRWSCQHVDDLGRECDTPGYYGHQAPHTTTSFREGRSGLPAATWCHAHAPRGAYCLQTGEKIYGLTR